MHKSQALNDSIFEHCNQSIGNALSVERYPSWKRSCSELKDIDYTHGGTLMFQMTLCINVLCSYMATMLPKVAGVFFSHANPKRQ